MIPNSALNRTVCGFDHLRLNDEGRYQCYSCGKVMDDNFAEMVLASLGQKWLNKLKAQARLG